jgi:hypothetical protein
MTFVTTWVTEDASVADHVVPFAVRVPMRPEFDLRTIKDKLFELRRVCAIYQVIVRVVRRNALKAWGVMSAYYKLLIMFSFNYFINVLLAARVTTYDMSRTKLSLICFIIDDQSKVVHHITNRMKRQRIAVVHVSPQRATDESNIIHFENVVL